METIHDKILDAIATPERRLWLDPTDCSEISEDVSRALGYEPTDPAPPETVRYLLVRDPSADSNGMTAFTEAQTFMTLRVTTISWQAQGSPEEITVAMTTPVRA
jgi:hypothetical protein